MGSYFRLGRMMVMNENNGKKAKSLAITEKQSGHHRSSGRPGGCVGIFFQLFDWNRRLAKKKLFPKKLLPLPGLFSPFSQSSYCVLKESYQHLHCLFSLLVYLYSPCKTSF